MARLARVITRGFPHHVTQRGNRRQPTFFQDDDYGAYVDFLREQCAAYGVGVVSDAGPCPSDRGAM
ncbi:hypothetical protein HQ520_07920 [bacterium]|nr:hypothetical protein [bacterium]